MVIYITIILAFVLLQLVKETYPRIHSIVYTIYIFLFLTYIFTVLIIPYVSQYISVIPANLLPVFKLLLFSVVLLFLSQIIEELFLDYEYTSLASLFTFTTKAILLIVWLNHMQQFYDKFLSILGLLS
ncbi:hypothetical protein MPH47_17735 [Psychrobacillus psychrodurans]|jgi:hypothetical protein|uniref:hypothetical protein n=1 Tax=Psychrobacillus TaxID=1221880 RepID=UPI0008F11898|nr:hypothetical protein [Psychrobacillus psychrodurans]MCK1999042.1 hypothetical protein [Psychrobacillus psychrodurans]MCZ8542379.1 hypothetical protein [Psychrobacillus psychrodurans]SFN21273.1 hypothetical protein SAMN05421832_12135 [Psychrobacillus psychrodurans]